MQSVHEPSRRRTRTRIGSPFLVLLAAALCLPIGAAQADIRIWEQHAGEPGHRYFDLTGYLQPGFVLRQNDPNAPVTDNQFWLQRARFGFKSAIGEHLFLRLELETTPAPVLNDAYVEFRLHPAFRVRAGQFQMAFLRTFQFGEPQLAFIDRSVFTPQAPDRPYLRYLTPRDIGLMFTGFVGDPSTSSTSPVLEYWAGTFVGRGSNQTRNDNNSFLYSLRTQLHVLGVPEGVEAESDLARNESPRVSVAAGAYTNCDDRGQWNRGLTSDVEFRWNGLFASAAAVWFRNGESRGLGNALGYGPGCGKEGGLAVPDHIATGASAQVQYVLPKRWFPWGDNELELLLRWDAVSPYAPVDRSSFLGRLLGGGKEHSDYVAPPSFADADNAPTRWRTTVGANWFPTGRQTLRLSLNYQFNQEAEAVQTGDRFIETIANDVLWLQMTAGI